MTTSREEEIKSTLKRCSDDTVSAAIRFQTSHSPEDLATVIHGVLKRDLPETHTEALATATDDSRLVEDLGMDSFGMIELVMAAEEIFAITIPNQELRDVTTLGSLKSYVLEKVKSTHAADQAA